MFVIDASLAMAWCFEDEATDQTDAVLDRLRTESAIVPALWSLEVANVLLVAERRGRIREAEVTRFVALLGQLPIEIRDDVPRVTDLVGLGRTHQLSAYDAAYLHLAERAGVPLATLDAGLRRAAAAAGVPLLLGSAGSEPDTA